MLGIRVSQTMFYATRAAAELRIGNLGGNRTFSLWSCNENRMALAPSIVSRNAIKNGATLSFTHSEGSSVLHCSGAIIGSGGEKTVMKGTLSDTSGVNQVAILINHLKSSIFALWFGGSGSEKQRQELHEKVHREEQLLEVVSGSEYIDQTSLFPPMHTEDGILRATHLAKGSLETLLKGEMTLPKAVEILSDAAEGLSHIHDRGYVHSDVKPENILVTDDGRGRVTDIGCMGEVGVELIGGTRGYYDPSMPIDQESRTQYLAKESDVYAFGITMLDIITPHDWSTTVEQREFQKEVLAFGCTAFQANSLQRPTAREISEELQRMNIRAGKLGFSPLGEINLHNKVLQTKMDRLQFVDHQ